MESLIEHPQHNLEYWRQYNNPYLKWISSHIKYISNLITEEVNKIDTNSSNWYKLKQDRRLELEKTHRFNEYIKQYLHLCDERIEVLNKLSNNITYIPSDRMIHLITSKLNDYYSYEEHKHIYAMGALYPFADKLRSLGFKTLIQLNNDNDNYTLSANCYVWMFYSIRFRITPEDFLASCKMRNLPREVFDYEILNFMEGK